MLEAMALIVPGTLSVAGRLLCAFRRAALLPQPPACFVGRSSVIACLSLGAELDPSPILRSSHFLPSYRPLGGPQPCVPVSPASALAQDEHFVPPKDQRAAPPSQI